MTALESGMSGRQIEGRAPDLGSVLERPDVLELRGRKAAHPDLQDVALLDLSLLGDRFERAVEVLARHDPRPAHAVGTADGKLIAGHGGSWLVLTVLHTRRSESFRKRRGCGHGRGVGVRRRDLPAWL